MRGLARAAWLALACAACAACDGGRWVIGEEAGGAGAPGFDEAAQSAGTGASNGCPGGAETLALRSTWHGPSEVGARHAGDWVGALSGSAAVAFPSAEVAMLLRPDNTGTLTFGGSPPPPVPFDARQQPYLCSGDASGGVCGTSSGFIGGFGYTLTAINVRGGVLSFVLLDTGPWDPWCALQIPLGRMDPLEPCGYSFGVFPPGTKRWSPTGCSLVEEDASEQPMDCGVMYALEHCQCAFDGCFAAFTTGIEVGMELSEDGRELSGSLWTKAEVDAARLLLRRQAP